MTGYPALVPEDGGVAVRVLQHRGEQQRRRNARLARARCCCTRCRHRQDGDGGPAADAQRLALSQNPHGSVDALVEDCRAARSTSVIAHAPPVRTPAGLRRAGGAGPARAGGAWPRTRATGRPDPRAAPPRFSRARRLLRTRGAHATSPTTSASNSTILVFAGFVVRTRRRPAARAAPLSGGGARASRRAARPAPCATARGWRCSTGSTPPTTACSPSLPEARQRAPGGRRDLAG